MTKTVVCLFNSSVFDEDLERFVLASRLRSSTYSGIGIVMQVIQRAEQESIPCVDLFGPMFDVIHKTSGREPIKIPGVYKKDEQHYAMVCCGVSVRAADVVWCSRACGLVWRSFNGVWHYWIHVVQ